MTFIEYEFTRDANPKSLTYFILSNTLSYNIKLN